MYSEEERKFILQLAREAIIYYLDNNLELVKEEVNVSSDKLKQKQSCFVTLTINGELRGCVGHLEATEPLYRDVIENAVGAAFRDNRFEPLRKDELEKIAIEVSVLSSPQVLEYKNVRELLARLRPEIDGVIIEKGEAGATYLPQVWEELKTPEEFLSSLCLKAGLEEEEWEKGTLKVLTYTVEIIEE